MAHIVTQIPADISHTQGNQGQDGFGFLGLRNYANCVSRRHLVPPATIS